MNAFLKSLLASRSGSSSASSSSIVGLGRWFQRSGPAVIDAVVNDFEKHIAKLNTGIDRSNSVLTDNHKRISGLKNQNADLELCDRPGTEGAGSPARGGGLIERIKGFLRTLRCDHRNHWTQMLHAYTTISRGQSTDYLIYLCSCPRCGRVWVHRVNKEQV
jgi:hypothetical protein